MASNGWVFDVCVQLQGMSRGTKGLCVMGATSFQRSSRRMR